MLPHSEPADILRFVPTSAAPHSRRLNWLRAKRVFDLAASGTMLLLSMPVLLVAMALVKLTSRGPAIYSQKRIGLRGRVFTIYKVRSMRSDAESTGGPRWCVPGDARVTHVGRVLRKIHVDELPQLWNVLRGEMSLIGPRPERPEFMPKIRGWVPGYDARHEVLPGITGLAQVQVDADTDFDNVARKLRYDLHYIRHLGPWIEVKILACTALKVIGVPLATLRSLLNLNLEPVAERVIRRAA